MKRLIILFLVFLIFTWCNKNKNPIYNSEKVNIYPGYPTTLYPLSESELNALQAEFDSLNNNRICTYLDEYGLTRNGRYCRTFNNTKISQDSALDIAVNTVLRNSKFTNVKDRLLLIENGYTIRVNSSDSSKWEIRFNPQHYEGLEIPFSWINVIISGHEPYSITGHWYSNILIPQHDNFNIEEAKQKILEEKIVWYGIDGKPRDYYISKNSILEPINKAIFPLRKENLIELRVTWKIPIDFGGFTGWYIYFDSITGEIVFTEPLFVS
jgi:hypothetical protein